MCLADNLQQSINQQESQDKMKILKLILSVNEWNSLNKLAQLLLSFAQTTEYIEESQYPTLGMMIPTIIKVSHHLYNFYPRITSVIVKACCIKINESILSRWSKPLPNSLVTSFLDMRLKKINFITSSKKIETIIYLCISFSIQKQLTSI
ncbi:8092_t:CDS:1 [Cetraspora pellucida]|uniref:8092_t:CDS:1 n=1 Tax=Cetraspora pellucida TaxID=1433469 RepID=A0A9N9CF85_9GLOM|nr:8092_t:CDS:1 [Cetraspora pellucida]